jgi:hypothetical protein
LKVGFDIGYDDDDNGSDRDGQAVWNGGVDNYQNTANFGTITLNNGSASRLGEADANLEQTGTMSVYPSPVTGGMMTAYLPVSWSGEADVIIRNATGEVVWEGTKIVSDDEIDLNVDGLTSGMYFIQVSNGGNTYTKKFIKQ